MIYIRLKIGRNVDISTKTGIEINPLDWSDTKSDIKTNLLLKEPFAEMHEQMGKIKQNIQNALRYESDLDSLNKAWLDKVLFTT